MHPPAGQSPGLVEDKMGRPRQRFNGMAARHQHVRQRPRGADREQIGRDLVGAGEGEGRQEAAAQSARCAPRLRAVEDPARRSRRAVRERLSQTQAGGLERLCARAYRVGAAHHARLLEARVQPLSRASGQILGFAALPSPEGGPFFAFSQKKSSGLSIPAGVARRDGRARHSGHRTPGSEPVGDRDDSIHDSGQSHERLRGGRSAA